jgi:hypothetical protein
MMNLMNFEILVIGNEMRHLSTRWRKEVVRRPAGDREVGTGPVDPHRVNRLDMTMTMSQGRTREQVGDWVLTVKLTKTECNFHMKGFHPFAGIFRSETN